MLKINKIISISEDKIAFNVTAPLYWWIDECTVVASSIPWEEVIKTYIKGKNFTLNDFSVDGLFERSLVPLEETIKVLNYYRLQYIEQDISSTSSKKEYLQQIFKLLPNNYNITSNVTLSMGAFNFMVRWFRDSSYNEWGEFFKCLLKEIDKE